MNALARERSPYLRRHAANPVDWLPWGEEALRRAREQERPLLVSIGYSACHWCHVMERESFSDPAVAAIMNELFVCVKVDREERPDVDAISMEAVQAMTGQGGWPLHVFLTPEQAPFYGGTYFPPAPRDGMPAWPQVLQAVAEAWRTQRDEVLEQGERMAGRLAGGAALRPTPDRLDPVTLDAARATLRTQFDTVDGGWSGAPKFPAPSTIEFLLRRGETAMSGYTLTSMASGGIYDQLGGGFARYAVDTTWTVPHFEKMLPDNALLARAYLHGFQVTGNPVFRRVCEETLDWLLRDLSAPEGGFCSSLDADSDGAEGTFYLWTVTELRAALGGDAETAIAWFGATEAGNLADPDDLGAHGRNVLEERGVRPDAPTAARIRGRLRELREQRTWPTRDDTCLAAWNGLAISALADAGAVLGREDYREAARRAAMFVLDRMRAPAEDGTRRLLRSYAAGEARVAAFLEDHAFLLEALVQLYEATFEPRWLVEARELADAVIARFADREHGGFFSTADDAEPLAARRKELEDQPIPSGGSSAALGLLRLAALTGEHRYEAAAEGHLQLLQPLLARHAGAFGHTLQALDERLGPRREVAVVGTEAERTPLVAVVREALRPGVVLAAGPGPVAGVPLLAGRTDSGAYVCERFACHHPVQSAPELRRMLDEAQ